MAELEHLNPGAGGNKWPRACWAPMMRTDRRVQTQPQAGTLLVKVPKPYQRGAKGFFVVVVG